MAGCWDGARQTCRERPAHRPRPVADRVRRFAAFDPPEYLAWRPDAKLARAFRATLDADRERARVVRALSADHLLGLYAGLLRARLHDIQLKRWVRGGVISKAWLGTGEEATTVGPARALERGLDIVAPMIRNAAACCEMGMPIADMLRAYLATADSPSRGRDVHLGDLDHGVLQPISHVGDMVPVITGIALTFKLRAEGRVALTWVGDGTTKTAAAHEGMNFAAVQKVPAIFILQNNQVALGTRLDAHHVPKDFHDWPASYGIFGATFDGNNVLDAYAATKLAAERCRRGEGPVMLVGETFRMGGHATHDEAEARATFPDATFKAWGTRDPIGLYEEYLKEAGRTSRELEDVEKDVTSQMDGAAREALQSRERMPPGESALDGMYAAGRDST
jgi:TPP-dependent pyruvate/acetoin dehydrogenase alpha subunit